MDRTTKCGRSPSAYLTHRWLPGKKLTLAHSTWDGYRRKIERHILPAIGHLRIRRLRAQHLKALYDRMLHPTDGRRPLATKTVLEVHLIVRGALNGRGDLGIGVRPRPSTMPDDRAPA